jgi:hypothetical protein
MNIEQKALELARLRDELSAPLIDEDFERWIGLLAQVHSVVESLQEALIKRSSVTVQNPEAATVLREIHLSDFENIERLGEELLYSWFSPREYGLELSLVDALILPISVPAPMRVFVEEARQCYAFGQYNAVYSLSRTILESAVNDLCIRAKHMPKRILDEDLFYKEGYSFRKRLSFLSSGSRLERIAGQYKVLCGVIHGGATADGFESLKALVETLGLVRDLYASNRHTIRGAT